MPSIRSLLTGPTAAVALDWTDWVTYGYLFLGLLLMFGPVLWLVMSSFKTAAALNEFPPRFLPYGQKSVALAGPSPTLPRSIASSFRTERRARWQSCGASAFKPRWWIPPSPSEEIKVNIRDRRVGARVSSRDRELHRALRQVRFRPLSLEQRLHHRRRDADHAAVQCDGGVRALEVPLSRPKTAFIVILATLMIPPTIILVPNFLVASSLGLLNSPWGVIWPAVATPTGVFLLRQYMLTLPDELLDAARMDHASEWRIFWRIVLPLSAPALAVLAIFSVMWRWNDFLWPLVVLSKTENFTLQLALNAFQGELTTQWHFLLAMTVLTLLPVTLVFALLQRHITTGIASAGSSRHGQSCHAPSASSSGSATRR